MNTETKQPAAGEYWEFIEDGRRVKIVCIDDGDVIYRTEDLGVGFIRGDISPTFIELARHLPDCDSFGWKETVYPRYAVPSTDLQHHSQISFISQENQQSNWNILYDSGVASFYRTNLFQPNPNRWKIVSREEAEARHARLHREWVISQLVIIDREKWPDHVPRAGIDWITANDVRGCIPIKPGNQPKNSDLGCCFKIYCLPKDLPPEPSVTTSPGRSFRTIGMEIVVSGATRYICKVPLTVDGPVTVELILDDNDPAKVVSRTVHLVNEEEF